MKTKTFIFLLLSIGMFIETKAQEIPADSLLQGDFPELGWGIIGNPIIKDDFGKRDLIVLPEVMQENGALCFTSPIAMSLPYYIIHEGNAILGSGTLTLVAQKKETINTKHLPSGTYLFVLNFGNICYGCRFEVE